MVYDEKRDMYKRVELLTLALKNNRRENSKVIFKHCDTF